MLENPARQRWVALVAGLRAALPIAIDEALPREDRELRQVGVGEVLVLVVADDDQHIRMERLELAPQVAELLGNPSVPGLVRLERLVFDALVLRRLVGVAIHVAGADPAAEGLPLGWVDKGRCVRRAEPGDDARHGSPPRVRNPRVGPI